MNKLSMQTANQAVENAEKIAKLFPHCVTEEGKIDFDLLQQELNQEVLAGQERYQLNWVGKRQAIVNANTPTTQTLRPVREESVNFDHTQNLFIEGDNLEALKLLQETYLGKVKMIYIDPPYNTGNDFIYPDNFAQSAGEYALESQQKDENGYQLVANPESNGRFHSDWLSMIYPRLKIAHRLLRDDGVIFISIDDNEQANLKKVCDEIFGGQNFVACLPTVMNLKGNNDQFGFAGTHEYTLVYMKNKNSIEDLNGIPLEEEDFAEYDQFDEKGAYKQGATLMRTGEAGARESRPKGYYPIYVSEDCSRMSLEKLSETDIEVFPKTTEGKDMSWRRSPQNLRENIDEFIIKRTRNGISFYKKQRLEDDKVKGKKPKSLFYKPEYSSGNGTLGLLNIFNEKIFDNPKPITLIQDFILVGTNKNDIILDFFAGSGTTAHAVIKLNAEDGGNRKFITVQLPENLDSMLNQVKGDNKKSIQNAILFLDKIEKPHSISEITKERIRRAGTQILQNREENQPLVDVGFRVLKIDSSNMQPTFYTPNATSQDLLASLTDNIKPNRTAEDLLFQVMLSTGMPLSSPIVQESLNGNTVFTVADSLVACFDEAIDEQLITQLAQRQVAKLVFREAGFKDDVAKINAEQIVKQLANGCEICVI